MTGKVKDASVYGSPHEKLAKSINSDMSSSTVGGSFGRGPAGEIITNENSGHFGQNWTPEIRNDFVKTMKSYGLEVNHQGGVW